MRIETAYAGLDEGFSFIHNLEGATCITTYLHLCAELSFLTDRSRC